MGDNLGDRMKGNYENRSQVSLIRRMPVILRLDGRAFHTLTRGCQKPFDQTLSDCMAETAMFLCGEIQGTKLAYVQSDEISLLLTDFDTLTTQSWFDNNVQKMVSVSAGLASAYFTKLYGKFAVFDSRAFNVPKEDVCNYFIWRQKDWIRNSVQMLAQSHFSHKQLQNKGQTDMHDMLMGKSVNWGELEPRWMNGTVVYREINTSSSDRWHVNNNIIFTKDRGFVESYLLPSEDK